MRKKDLIKENKELKNKVCYLENGIEELKKEIAGDCVISDHCVHCKHSSVTENFYNFGFCNNRLITCDLYKKCKKYERKNNE